MSQRLQLLLVAKDAQPALRAALEASGAAVMETTPDALGSPPTGARLDAVLLVVDGRWGPAAPLRAMLRSTQAASSARVIALLREAPSALLAAWVPWVDDVAFTDAELSHRLLFAGALRDAQPARATPFLPIASTVLEDAVLIDRVDTLSAIGSGVSHELSSPLSYVLANLEQAQLMLQDTPPADPAELQSMLSDALVGANKLSALLSDLKLLTRIKSPSPSVDLKRLVDAALSVAAHEVRHRVQVVRHDGPVRGFPGQEAHLAQLCLHLVLDAVHRLPPEAPGGTELVVRTFEDGPWAVLEVEGAGSHRASGEHALSHSVCRRIVAQHRGQLTERASPSGGTCLSVRLPLEELEEAAAPEPTPVATGAARPRLLVVDDDELVGRGMVRLLNSTHEVVTTTEAAMALRWLARGDRFDAVLCDVMMPGMDGVAFYEALERADPEMAARVLFITGGVYGAAAARFLEAHADRRLDKPVQRHTLEAALARLVSRDRSNGER